LLTDNLMMVAGRGGGGKRGAKRGKNAEAKPKAWHGKFRWERLPEPIRRHCREPPSEP
jgi:hypothetical protein